MSVFYYLSLILFCFLCVLLCFVILIQESKSSGLGSSFGDASSSVFGTGTAEVLQKFTAYLAAFFMLACIIFSTWSSSAGRSDAFSSKIDYQQESSG